MSKVKNKKERFDLVVDNLDFDRLRKLFYETDGSEIWTEDVNDVKNLLLGYDYSGEENFFFEDKEKVDSVAKKLGAGWEATKGVHNQFRMLKDGFTGIKCIKMYRKGDDLHFVPYSEIIIDDASEEERKVFINQWINHHMMILAIFHKDE